MGTVNLGAEANLKVAKSGESLVDVTADGLGTGDITKSRVYQSSPVPGARGRGGVQPGKFFSDSLTVTLDDNDVTLPIFGAAACQRIDLELQPRGEGTGKPQETSDAVVTSWSKSYSISPDTRRFSITATYDGSPTQTTQ